MAIIDTLKLARALHAKGGFSQEAADATAEALNAALGEDVATKADIVRAVDKLTARLNFMQWQIGTLAALQIATLVKLFIK
jgi:hypothetical protein